MHSLASLAVLAILSLSFVVIFHMLYANRERIAQALAGVPVSNRQRPAARTSRVARGWAQNDVRVKTVPLCVAA